MSGHLSGKRVLVIGADSERGRTLAAAFAATGAHLALVAATADAEAAFAVQRLARRLAAARGETHAQAIDATNEMAMRVMVRQVAKEMGGLDAVVFCAEAPASLQLALRFAGREMARGGGVFVTLAGVLSEEDRRLLPAGVALAIVPAGGRPAEEIAAEAFAAVAAGHVGR